MAVVEALKSVKQAIKAYTGMSLMTFFTVLAVPVAFYYAAAGFFKPTPRTRSVREFEEAEPLPQPVQLGEITEEDLRAYDGSDPQKPLLMAIKGQIYDVTENRMFYGPGGPYALFAGKDASRALAKMSFEPKDLTGDISGLGPFEVDTLQDWEYNFMSKYVKVGTIKKVESVTVEPGVSTSDATEETSQITETSVSQLDHTAQAEDTTAEIDTDSERCAMSKEEGETGKDFEVKENDQSADVKDAHNA